MKTKTDKQSQAAYKALLKKNQKFNALPLWKKRVAVAKDALRQLAGGRFVPMTSNWISYSLNPGTPGTTFDTFDQPSFRTRGIRCHGCALGAALFSFVRLGDEFSATGPYVRTEDAFEKLDELFSTQQKRLIEIAYELGNGYYWRTDELSDAEKRAIVFGKKYDSLAPRMRAIFRNIIANKGEFKP